MSWKSLGVASKLTVFTILGMAAATFVVIAMLEGGISLVAVVPSLFLVLMAGLATSGKWIPTGAAALLASLTGFFVGVSALVGGIRIDEIWPLVVLPVAALFAGVVASKQTYRSER